MVEDIIRHTWPEARIIFQNTVDLHERPDLLHLELERFERLYGNKLRERSPEQILSALEKHIEQAKGVEGYANTVNWSVRLLALVLALYPHRESVEIPRDLQRRILHAADDVSSKISGGPDGVRLSALSPLLELIFKHIGGKSRRK